MLDFSESLKAAFDTKVDTTQHAADLALKANKASPTFTGDVIVGGRVKASSFQTTSDRRLKTNIRSLEEVDLGSLKAMKFRFKDASVDRIGLIAQDVQQIVPEAVWKDVDGMLSIDYNALVAVCIDKINKLEREVEALKEIKHV